MSTHAIDQALETACSHHQAGRLAEAEEIYRRILAGHPDHPDALHLLGVLAYQVGRLPAAIELISRAVAAASTVALFHSSLGEAYRKAGREELALASLNQAIALAPGLCEAHNSLGMILKQRGCLEEALGAFRRAIALRPGFAEAFNNLGVTLHETSQREEALAALRRAIALDPGYADAHHNLGVVLHAMHQLDEAMAACRQAIVLKPAYAEAYNTLGVILNEVGRSGEAISALEYALVMEPELAEIHQNLGNALRDAGRLDEAAAALGRAITRRPDSIEAHNNLGVVLELSGRFKEAIAAFRRAVELGPDAPEAHTNLGVPLYETGDVDEAVAACRRATELRGDDPRYQLNLGNALLAQGEREQAISAFSRALELRPSFATAHSNLLMASQYLTGVTRAGLAATHAEWEERHAAPLHVLERPWNLERDPERPLRLGFVSPDLGRHPVGLFLVGALRHLDGKRLAVVCYSTRPLRDDVSDRLAAASHEWHNLAHLDDDALAARIRADHIDILFDLAGHTADGRLLLFARRPAPIQITWIGYVGTTGLKAMDYLLADRFHVPPGTETHYQEKVLRMPDGYVCYQLPAETPPVGPLPALARGQVTFGCFNNVAKLTPEAIQLWAEIVRRVPGSRLLLISAGLGGSIARDRIAASFAAAGADRRSLDMRGALPWADLMAAYNSVDLALDPFPYSGGLTTCEALSMGVPVITCPGETFASRHSFSHLSNVGLTETIAPDLAHYADLAARLAGDLPHLAEIRAGLRDRMVRSPLCDGARFARNFAHLLREVWREWCKG